MCHHDIVETFWRQASDEDDADEGDRTVAEPPTEDPERSVPPADD